MNRSCSETPNCLDFPGGAGCCHDSQLSVWDGVLSQLQSERLCRWAEHEIGRSLNGPTEDGWHERELFKLLACAAGGRRMPSHIARDDPLAL